VNWLHPVEPNELTAKPFAVSAKSSRNALQPMLVGG
jgi:hypothetical protein